MNISKEVRKGRLDKEKEREREKKKRRRMRKRRRDHRGVHGDAYERGREFWGAERMFGGGGGLNVVLSSRTVRP